MSEALRKVAEAKSKLDAASETFEAELREKLEQKLADFSLALDVAAAEAYRSGEKKIAIGVAMNTRDYSTYNARIKHGDAVLGTPIHDPIRDAENGVQRQPDYVVANAPDGKGIMVWDNDKNQAEFDVERAEDGTLVFLSRTPLWDREWSNPIVLALDMKTSGPLYKQATAFVNEE